MRACAFALGGGGGGPAQPVWVGRGQTKPSQPGLGGRGGQVGRHARPGSQVERQIDPLLGFIKDCSACGHPHRGRTVKVRGAVEVNRALGLTVASLFRGMERIDGG